MVTVVSKCFADTESRRKPKYPVSFTAFLKLSTLGPVAFLGGHGLQ